MAENEWKKNVHALRSVTDLENFDDLQPLKEVFKSVRIVGLGEATHGTREFFQLKHRLLAFLVKEMGFRAFLIEAGSLPCQNINDYVLYGKGDRHAALASQGYWTWDTEEVRDMIEWMRQFNLSCQREEMIQFIGYDIKPVEEAYGHLKRLLPAEALEMAGIDEIKALMDKDALTPEEHEEVKERILKLNGIVQLRDQEIRAAVGQKGLELAQHCANMLWQDYGGMKAEPYSLVGRDKSMAENTIDIMRQLPTDSKVVVWAHNAHIAIDPEWTNLGFRLREAYGDQYCPAALTFTQGGFQSRYIHSEVNHNYEMGDLQEFVVGEPMDNYWEKELKDFAQGDYYLDFRPYQKQADFQDWAMNRELAMFGAGGGFVPFEDQTHGEEYFSKSAIGKQFDGVFHIQSTTRARPNPTGMRVRGQKSK